MKRPLRSDNRTKAALLPPHWVPILLVAGVELPGKKRSGWGDFRRANGKVYVSGYGALVVYGLLP